MLVEKEEPSEVCLLSKDVSGFECLIQLMNCQVEVFVPSFLGIADKE